MTLTARQIKAIARAPQKDRKALEANFARQQAPKATESGPKPAKRPPQPNGPRMAAGATTRTSLLDPLHPAAMPAIQSAGNALPHTSLVSTDFVVGTTNTTCLVVGNVGNAATVGFIVEVNPSGELVNSTALHIPTLAQADADGGPSSGRAMKCSATVLNCSNALKRGGRVTYINSSQRLPALHIVNSLWTFSGFVSGIKSSPYRRRVMGDNLAKAAQLITYPCDSTTYERYSPWRGSLTFDEFFAHVVASSHNGISVPDAVALNQRPMSVVAYVFDPVAEPQDYSVTVRASFYTRWPLTTVPGQSMGPTPTAKQESVNGIIDKAEAAAHELLPVSEGALAATLGPRLFGTLGNVARGAAGLLRAGGGAAIAAAEEAGMAAPLLLL